MSVKTLRLGVAGLGTVGVGVVQMLQEHSELLATRTGCDVVLSCVSARDASRDRGVDVSGYEWVDDALALASRDDVDVVVELIGGADGVAYDLVKAALENGKSVVTANKALMAHHGAELAEIAERNGVALSYEAAVAGGIPIVKAMRESLMGNDISAVYGILNGTSNYILSEMRIGGRGFDDVLQEAQDKGYAEADPSFDIDGTDAGHKLALLAAIAFGVKPSFDAMSLSGISHLLPEDLAFADELGYRVKLLGIAQLIGGAIVQSVEPCFVPLGSPLGLIEDVYNAVYVEGSAVETPFFSGKGAGRLPTASSVMGDIVDLARGLRVPTFGVPAANLGEAVHLDVNQVKSRFYLRLNVLDQPGVIADVAAILRDLGVSIESMVQRGRDPGEQVHVVMKTHGVTIGDIRAAIAKIEALNCSFEKPCLIRIEDDL